MFLIRLYVHQGMLQIEFLSCFLFLLGLSPSRLMKGNEDKTRSMILNDVYDILRSRPGQVEQWSMEDPLGFCSGTIPQANGQAKGIEQFQISVFLSPPRSSSSNSPPRPSFQPCSHAMRLKLKFTTSSSRLSPVQLSFLSMVKPARPEYIRPADKSAGGNGPKIFQKKGKREEKGETFLLLLASMVKARRQEEKVRRAQKCHVQLQHVF